MTHSHLFKKICLCLSYPQFIQNDPSNSVAIWLLLKAVVRCVSSDRGRNTSIWGVRKLKKIENYRKMKCLNNLIIKIAYKTKQF